MAKSHQSDQSWRRTCRISRIESRLTWDLAVMTIFWVISSGMKCMAMLPATLVPPGDVAIEEALVVHSYRLPIHVRSNAHFSHARMIDLRLIPVCLENHLNLSASAMAGIKYHVIIPDVELPDLD